jgi:drug/metabolite transporter (DMT)-like permease
MSLPFDFWAAMLYIFNGILSAVIMVKIRNNSVAPWSSFLPSLIGMVLWAIIIRKSRIPSVELSALYDVLGALAYFIGFYFCGEKITQIQWIGIGFLLFSLYLINR